MSKIRVDRGFEERLRHKGHLNTALEGHPPHAKGRAGLRSMAGVALAAFGVAVVAGLAVWAAVRSGGDPQRAAAGEQGAAPLAPAAAQKASEPLDVVEPEAGSDKGAAAEQAPTPPAASPQAAAVTNAAPDGLAGLLCEYYEQIQGRTIDQLRAAPNFPAKPSRTIQLGEFSLPVNAGNHYGARVRGYLVPPSTAKYKFAVCADDTAEFWLSADDTEANLRKLIGPIGPTLKQNWRSKEGQMSEGCELVGGRRYFVEALFMESMGNDHLSVGWSGPFGPRFAVIEGRYLQPWTGRASPAPSEPPSAAAPRDPAEIRQRIAGIAAVAHQAVLEQKEKNAKAYRYTEAARVLASVKTTLKNPKMRDAMDTVIQRYELLAKVRACVQAELVRAPVREVWTAFGGRADVTMATDEGLTVAPGRIIEWAKVPPEQMLKLVNAILARAVADPGTKGELFLAAAVFCKEVSGGAELSQKYRERALAFNSRLAAQADRVLSDGPVFAR